MKTRRGFLGSIAVAAVGLVAAIYVPGKPWNVTVPDVWVNYRVSFTPDNEAHVFIDGEFLKTIPLVEGEPFPTIIARKVSETSPCWIELA